MPDDSPVSGPIPLEAWLQRLANIMGPAGGPGLSDDEQAAILDVARLAAHKSERIAAPLTTFMAGLACAELQPWERAETLQSLVEQLEAGPTQA